jgi:hypothetical protein
MGLFVSPYRNTSLLWKLSEWKTMNRLQQKAWRKAKFSKTREGQTKNVTHQRAEHPTPLSLSLLHLLLLLYQSLVFLLWRFDPIPGHGFPWRGLTITLLDTPKSVGLLSTTEHPDAEASTSQHKTLTTKHPHSGGIRTHNPSKRAVADPRFRPRAHSLLLPSHTSDRRKQGKHKLQSAKRYTQRFTQQVQNIQRKSNSAQVGECLN